MRLKIFNQSMIALGQDGESPVPRGERGLAGALLLPAKAGRNLLCGGVRYIATAN
jgi:hypothetical protein